MSSSQKEPELIPQAQLEKTELKQPKFHPESKECLAPIVSCLYHSDISRKSQEVNLNYCILLTSQNISYYYVSAMAWQVLF